MLGTLVGPLQRSTNKAEAKDPKGGARQLCPPWRIIDPRSLELPNSEGCKIKIQHSFDCNSNPEYCIMLYCIGYYVGYIGSANAKVTWSCSSTLSSFQDMPPGHVLCPFLSTLLSCSGSPPKVLSPHLPPGILPSAQTSPSCVQLQYFLLCKQLDASKAFKISKWVRNIFQQSDLKWKQIESISHAFIFKQTAMHFYQGNGEKAASVPT